MAVSFKHLLSTFLVKKRIITITAVFWFLLAYILAALIWWFISLEHQNEQMFQLRVKDLPRENPAVFARLYGFLLDEKQRKTAQYLGEGCTFLLISLACAIFVYQAARRQLRLSAQQQNFMMSVTHELKTPQAIIQLNLETILKRNLPEEKQKKLIQSTIQEANRLNNLTSSILITSQLESGQFNIQQSDIDLTALLMRVEEEFKERYPQRLFETNLPPRDVFVKGEPLLLQMLVNNLVDNAVKYSPADKPVSILLRQRRKHLYLMVRDEGPGIPAEEKKRVFDKFYRSGNELTRARKGTGLGLYLVKQIVHSHKAKISLHDNTPSGCIFTITFNKNEYETR